jgi:hypothetical protein
MSPGRGPGHKRRGAISTPVFELIHSSAFHVVAKSITGIGDLSAVVCRAGLHEFDAGGCLGAHHSVPVTMNNLPKALP